VLRRADIPLLVVPDVEPPSTDRRDPTAAIGCVLAATDFSPASLGAVSVAVQWARELRAPMVLAHVVKPADVMERWRSYVEALEAEHVEVAERQLRDVVSGLDSGPAGIEPVVAVGDPPDRIATIAVEKGAGLIVMGLARASTHPRPGAVAYGVVRLSHIPVLVIPPAA
jgi:nucleotide-binding universal stress UspA family protein